MIQSPILGKLMRCSPEKLKGRNLCALARQIETRTQGNQRAIDAELATLGYDTRRLKQGTAKRGR